MQPVQQLLGRDLDDDLWASSFRAAVASILGLDVADVPDFYGDDIDDNGVMTQLDAFLAPRGLCAIEMPLVPGESSLDEVLGLLATINGAFTYLLAGASRSGAEHVVVCEGAHIVHDPAPEMSGLVAPCANGVYVVLLLCGLGVTRPARGGARAQAQVGHRRLMH